MASLPLLLFGSIAILASILSLIFPETKGIKLPDTMDEAVNITKLKKERKLVSSIFWVCTKKLYRYTYKQVYKYILV